MSEFLCFSIIPYILRMETADYSPQLAAGLGGSGLGVGNEDEAVAAGMHNMTSSPEIMSIATSGVTPAVTPTTGSSTPELNNAIVISPPV